MTVRVRVVVPFVVVLGVVPAAPGCSPDRGSSASLSDAGVTHEASDTVSTAAEVTSGPEFDAAIEIDDGSDRSDADGGVLGNAGGDGSTSAVSGSEAGASDTHTTAAFTDTSTLTDGRVDASNTHVTDSAPPSLDAGAMLTSDTGDTLSRELDSSTTYGDETSQTEPDSGLISEDDSSPVVDGGVQGDATETHDGGAASYRFDPVSGFVDIEPVAYAIRSGRTEYQSSSARLFYSLIPADNDPGEAPLFVLFNGGPGYATSAGLLSFGTGPYTVGSDLTTPSLELNPSSWTQLGNLLYIDTRQTGFSYSTLPDPSDASAREAEMGPHNFNEYLDAADLVRTLLRVLAQNQTLQDNQVVLVGESYGGVRATLMLYYLIFPESLREEGYYYDTALADEIDQYYATASSTSAPATHVAQFPAQVLIQPWVGHTQRNDQYALECSPGSPELLVADQQGVTCDRVLSTNDPYNINMRAGWAASIDMAAQSVLSNVQQLPLLLGVQPELISGLPAEQRLGAYRIGDSPPDGYFHIITPTTPQLLDSYGVLPSWDFYHVLFSRRGWDTSFYQNPIPCALFNRVVQHVNTFVTHAHMDTVVRTSVLPTTLAACNQLYSAPPLDSIVLDEMPAPGVERPGWMRFQFNDSSDIGPAERVVRAPRYGQAGHMVSVTHAAELFADVAEFLEERGVR